MYLLQGCIQTQLVDLTSAGVSPSGLSLTSAGLTPPGPSLTSAGVSPPGLCLTSAGGSTPGLSLTSAGGSTPGLSLTLAGGSSSDAQNARLVSQCSNHIQWCRIVPSRLAGTLPELSVTSHNCGPHTFLHLFWSLYSKESPQSSRLLTDDTVSGELRGG